MKTQTRTSPAQRGFTDGCPRCGTPIPLPLANFCTQCRYPLRSDSWERAAKIRKRKKRGQ